ncbi:hypothetical protein GBAR_LOCUS16563 [Geodia barretti]|nr:hypothetical protein GBAR_LOCUS16563 [Geodia barretti]
MKVLLWLLHPHPKSRATLKDLERDRWTNQEVDISQFSFESVLVSRVFDVATLPHLETISTDVTRFIPLTPTWCTFATDRCAVTRPTDDKMFHSPKPHPHKDKPHPLSDDIHDIDRLLDTKLHLDSDSSFHSDRGD